MRQADHSVGGILPGLCLERCDTEEKYRISSDFRCTVYKYLIYLKICSVSVTIRLSVTHRILIDCQP